jgi:hypothetical protein
MKNLIIVLFLLCMGCDSDSGNEPIVKIQGYNPNDNTAYIHNIPIIGGSCISGKMICIDNKSCVCLEQKWIIIEDCSINKLTCYFNNLEHTINNIPYYAECD